MRFLRMQIVFTVCAFFNCLSETRIEAASNPTREPASAPSNVHSTLLPNGIPMHQTEFENGLHVIILERHEAPVVTFQVWYSAGSTQEKIDPKIQATGLAHLFEHMMFRGTRTVADGQFDLLLTAAGMQDGNATTSYDRTNYYQSVPIEALELVAKLEADRMTQLQIDSKLLETEKGAVLSERKKGMENPDQVANLILYQTAFTTHPYKWSVIGTEDEIKGFTVDQAMHFYQSHYAPHRATLLLAGDTSPSHALPILQKFFGPIPKSIPHQDKRDSRPAGPRTEPNQTQERRIVFTHPQISQGKLMIGFHAAAAVHPDLPALHIINAILTLGESSLLQQHWVDAGLASAIGGSLDELQDPGMLSLSADLIVPADPGKTADTPEKVSDRCVKVFDQQVEHLKTGLTAAEVERARNRLLLDYYGNWETLPSLGNFIGEYLIATGSAKFGFDLADKISKVPLATIKQVAAKYLSPQNRTLVIGKPGSEISGLIQRIDTGPHPKSTSPSAPTPASQPSPSGAKNSKDGGST